MPSMIMTMPEVYWKRSHLYFISFCIFILNMDQTKNFVCWGSDNTFKVCRNCFLRHLPIPTINRHMTKSKISKLILLGQSSSQTYLQHDKQHFHKFPDFPWLEKENSFSWFSSFSWMALGWEPWNVPAPLKLYLKTPGSIFPLKVVPTCKLGDRSVNRGCNGPKRLGSYLKQWGQS